MTLGRIYKHKEAAAALGISTSALHRLVKEHPHYALNGNRKLFEESDLELLRAAVNPEGVRAARAEQELARVRAELDRRNGVTAASGAGFVYFVLANDMLKIGFAVNVRRRMHHLRAGCPYPLELRASIAGTRRQELDLHLRFAALRVRGEWFRYEGDLKDYVEGLGP